MVVGLDGLHGHAPAGGAVYDLLGGGAVGQLLDAGQVILGIVHRLRAPVPRLLGVLHHDLPGVLERIDGKAELAEGVRIDVRDLYAGGRVTVDQLVRGQFHKTIGIVGELAVMRQAEVLGSVRIGALVIPDQIPQNIQGPRVRLDVGIHENKVGHMLPQVPLIVGVTAGQQQIALSRLRMQQLRRVVILLAQRHRGPLAGGVPKGIVQAIDPQHLTVQLPAGTARFAEPIVDYFRDRVRPDLDNGVFIGRIAAAMAGVEGDGGLQAGAVSADHAHGRAGADNVPALLLRLLKEYSGSECTVLPQGFRVHTVGRFLGGAQAGDNGHGGIGPLHCGPGLGSGPVLAAGQTQDGPGQGQQQNAEGRLHWPPGQLVQRVHRRDSFLQNELLMLNYTKSLS